MAQVTGYDEKKKPTTLTPLIRVKHVQRTAEGVAKVRAFQDAIAGFDAADEEDRRMREVEQAWSALDAVAIDPESPKPGAGTFTLVRNSVERALVTDYSRVYYLNARSTWFSVGKVDAEIGADGSLAKANGESGGGLPELVTATVGAGTGFLPVSELLKQKWKLTSTAQTLIGKPVSLQHEVLAAVEVEEHGYRYELTRESRDAPCTNVPYPAVDGQCLDPIPLDLARGAFTRLEIGGGPKDDKKPAIAVEGRITLPDPGKSKEDK
jgi:hypothetical protein